MPQIKKYTYRLLWFLLAVLYIVMVVANILSVNFSLGGSLLRYFCVICCFFLSLLRSKQTKSRHSSIFLLLGLLSTLIADGFLLFTENRSAGLFFFCLVHIFYILRCRPHWKWAAIAAALLAAGALLLPKGIVVFFQSILYAVLFFADLLCCATAPRLGIKKRLALAGLALFLLCDIHVVLYNLLPGGSWYYPVAAALIWIFYVPSQFLISISDAQKQGGLFPL